MGSSFLHLVGVISYLAAGMLFMNYTWNEDTDEAYGELKPRGRYFFVTWKILLWPISGAIWGLKQLRRKAFRYEDE